ncbi:transposase [Streptomyces solisilvae]|uniref:transposase n=1 Tax=Streptomyces malaysiensis TaxID=92644 RepID=UPI00332B309A
MWIAGLSVVVSVVQRLVPDELWELFQPVVPEAPSRPQGGGRRRHGDREVLAAIVFVATSGRTWQQLPAASFGLWELCRPRPGLVLRQGVMPARKLCQG